MLVVHLLLPGLVGREGLSCLKEDRERWIERWEKRRRDTGRHGKKVVGRGGGVWVGAERYKAAEGRVCWVGLVGAGRLANAANGVVE